MLSGWEDPTIFLKHYSGSKRGGGCNIAFKRFFFYILFYWIALKLLGLHDPIILLKVVVDLRGVEGVK